MIYYIINTQYMNKFFRESTCELLFQYASTAHGQTDTFPNGPPPSCILLTLQHIKRGKNTVFQSAFSF